jgi:UDP-N-acetylmuramate: L-alanyl-gamma-D-glutamyl-meso-diaminopimelate ligase
MRLGVHQKTLLPALSAADQVFWGNLDHLDWLAPLLAGAGGRHHCADTVDALIGEIVRALPSRCHIVIMSNGGFGGLHRRLVQALEARHG